ncbi:BLUF domain-containing protein [Maribacter sp.]|nr:BLUF domain-containing protein [Maribacter sp.]
MYFSLVYSSTAALDISHEDILEICSSCKRNNSRYNITGILVFKKPFFFQILEGSKKDVMELYYTIEDDIRHSAIEIFEQGEHSERLFQTWEISIARENSYPDMGDGIKNNSISDLMKLLREQNESI